METNIQHFGLFPRQQKSPAEEFIGLISDPFRNQLVTAAFWSSLATALGTTLLLGLVFSLLRPHNATVYAPRLKRAHGHHAPPPLGKGLFAWITPVRKTREAQLIDAVGLDGAVFLRFTRMLRNMFLAMSLVGCAVLIPANVAGRRKTLPLTGFMLMTPSTVWGKPLWAQVICSWVFSLMIAGFLWFNYRAVTRLRRAYFESPEYQARLHSRTLLITDIPKAYRTDEGVYQVSDGTRSTSTLPRSVIGRNVKGLSENIRQHEKAVRQLESLLAKYLKDPHKLPASRPLCKPAKGDRSYPRGQKVDAIEYLTQRMQRLEVEIQRARDNIDMRNPMPYGFSSYDTMPEAHAAAYRARRKHKKGVTVRLAPAPEDIIWDNLPLSKATRRWKKFTNTLWVALLTVIWIVPNAMIAIFLSNLYNIGRVKPSLMPYLERNWRTLAVVQGVAAPAILSLVYLLLPIVFRRLSNRAGDTTKTSRERHVVHQLYAFFIFNNLVIFTIFSVIFQFVSLVVNATKNRQNVWDAIVAGQFKDKILSALCNVSPFWVTWLLQRNLGAAVDLSQLFNLLWIWCAKTFMAPTPRQREEWTRPPPFDYASYYNYFLFYATVALCFATLQPIVLPVTALYFALDSWLKKYLLLYIFYTKTESGGQFWRVVFNRMIFATILSNITVVLVVYARQEMLMVYTMAPLPFLMLLFKLYCKRAYDDDIHFYGKSLSDAHRSAAPLSKDKLRRENLAGRFENPAFWKPLMAPMVLEEAKGVLAQIYRGRLQSSSHAAAGPNAIHLEPMSEVHPGKSSHEDGGLSMNFKFIPESLLDNPGAYRDGQPDGGSEYFSGAESVYGGRPVDLISERPDTPGSYFSHKPHYPPSSGYDPSRTSSPAPSSAYDGGPYYHHNHYQHDPHAPPMPPLNRQYSSGSAVGGTTYPAHYHHPPYRSEPHQQHAYPPMPGGQGLYAQGNESRSGLLRSAADMPASSPYS